MGCRRVHRAFPHSTTDSCCFFFFLFPFRHTQAKHANSTSSSTQMAQLQDQGDYYIRKIEREKSRIKRLEVRLWSAGTFFSSGVLAFKIDHPSFLTVHALCASAAAMCQCVVVVMSGPRSQAQIELLSQQIKEQRGELVDRSKEMKDQKDKNRSTWWGGGSALCCPACSLRLLVSIALSCSSCSAKFWNQRNQTTTNKPNPYITNTHTHSMSTTVSIFDRPPRKRDLDKLDFKEAYLTVQKAIRIKENNLDKAIIKCNIAKETNDKLKVQKGKRKRKKSKAKNVRKVDAEKV